MEFLIIVGAKYLMVVLVVMFGTYALCSKERDGLLLAAAAVVPLAYLFARVAGLFFAHPQPFAAGGFEPLIPHTVDNSFPSDHAAVGGALAVLAWFYNRPLGFVLEVGVIAVGVSRAAAGLHYTADIAIGLLLGAAAALIIHNIFTPTGSRASP